MDEAEVVRINVPTKESADVTIDLRQNGLVHLFTVDNMEVITNLISHDNESSPKSNKEAADANFKSHNGSNHEYSNHSAEPSTIIHLKIVTPEFKKEGSPFGNSSAAGEKCFPNNSSQKSFTNKNCLRVRSSLCEMHREKKIEETNNQFDERKNILKEFEITRQLEKLRTETKKISRRKYTHHIERIPGHVQLNSPKSEVSDRSVTDISVIFSDTCEQTNPEIQSNHLKVVENSSVMKENEILGNLTPEETSNQMMEEESKSPKRKLAPTCGPLSKKMRLMGQDVLSQEQFAQIESSESVDCSRKRITFACCSPKMYKDGKFISDPPGVDRQSSEKEISLLVESEDDGDDYSQIGLESLVLWKLSNKEIDELKEQVKEEFEHKQKEHIMPLILNLSPDQIESTYSGVHDTMKMYDITEQDSDDDESQPSVEIVEEDCKLTELKSLDALYREEFSKEYYRDLFNTVEGDSFWKDEEDRPESKQTNYSKNRPKRSTVDYTPTAYSFIGYMEGRRTRRDSNSENRFAAHGRQRKVSYKEEDSESDYESSSDEFLDSINSSSSSHGGFDDDDDKNSKKIKLVDITNNIEEADKCDPPSNDEQQEDTTDGLSHRAKYNGLSTVLCKHMKPSTHHKPAAAGDANDCRSYKKLPGKIDDADSLLALLNKPSKQSVDNSSAEDLQPPARPSSGVNPKSITGSS